MATRLYNPYAIKHMCSVLLHEHKSCPQSGIMSHKHQSCPMSTIMPHECGSGPQSTNHVSQDHRNVLNNCILIHYLIFYVILKFFSPFLLAISIRPLIPMEEGDVNLQDQKAALLKVDPRMWLERVGRKQIWQMSDQSQNQLVF